jgi:hyperosmotically inducible protein
MRLMSSAIDAPITLLPVLQMDDRIRVTIANRTYTDPLFGYYSRANPPIHVIVENGHVTLVGIVASDIQRRKAELTARSVSGVFSVDDKLRLESELRGEWVQQCGR